jgi:glutamate carboxypeptidase
MQSRALPHRGPPPAVPVLFASPAALAADPSIVAGCAMLSARSEAMIESTMQWSAVNSGSREDKGLERMQSILRESFSALGRVCVEPLPASTRITAQGRQEQTPHSAALRVRVRPDAPLQVALTGHYDTVFAADHPFQTPVRRADGALHGPGVADMKGGIVVMREALLAFETLPFKERLGFEVLLSPDEEIGSPASAALLADLGARAHVGMTYEPALASGQLVNARKGSGIFTLVVTGRAAHVGRAFDEGRNAVAAAARVAAALDSLNGQREGVTVNVGAIDGGGPVNIVPDIAVLRFNIRAPDQSSADWALAALNGAIAAQPTPDGLSMSLSGGFGRPPKPLTPAQSKLAGWVAGLGQTLGMDLTFGPSGGVCEGNNLAAAGCPNIDTLGPCGGALHSSDEFALAESFAPRAQLSFMMLAAFASGVCDPADLHA